MLTLIVNIAFGAICVSGTILLSCACGMLLLWHTDEPASIRHHMFSTAVLLAGVAVLASVDRLAVEAWSRETPWPATFVEAAMLVVGGFAVLQIAVLAAAMVGWALRRRRRTPRSLGKRSLSDREPE